MSNDIKINNQLICLKTGSKAKIINYFDKDEVSYVKICIEMKFEDTKFQVLKKIQNDDVQNQFVYNKVNAYI